MEPYKYEEKGLFTFYREQADLEDELMQRLAATNIPDNNKQESQQKKLRHSLHNKSQLQKVKKGSHKIDIPKQMLDEVEKKLNDKSTKSQHKDKLIALLTNLNNIENRKNNFKVILNENQHRFQQESKNLKDHLQRLLKGQFQQAQNIGKSSNKLFAGKRQILSKLNPFQKLALIPTNFSTQFQVPQRHMIVSHFKKSPLQLSKSLQIRKNDKIVSVSHNLETKQQIKLSDLLLNKINLPKIQMRANSEMLSKISKLKSNQLQSELSLNCKIVEKPYFKQVITERFKQKHESLFLDSFKIGEPQSKSHVENKIYPLFIENTSLKDYQHEYKVERKQLIMNQILKKMKFT